MVHRAEIRRDFLRRMFAVAISVGFASTFIEMEWVKNADLPSEEEWQQISILITGLILTVMSWDGYLASIETKPLKDYFRFAIDIVLVIIYMFFLVSSKNPNFWLPLLSIIFVLYILWDFYSIKEYIDLYDATIKPADAGESFRVTVFMVLRVYGRGFCSSKNTDNGPVISVMWAMYFWMLLWMNVHFREFADMQVFVFCVFTIFGLILYRRDKSTMPLAGGRGFSMRTRTSLIGSLIFATSVYLFFFRIHPPGM